MVEPTHTTQAFKSARCPCADPAVFSVCSCTEGLYSDESAEDTLGEVYLRGYQLTNSSGYAQFDTLYPGWYSGRTTHVHFRLRLYENNTLTYDETTQFFFNDTLTDYIYANVLPYTQHQNRDTDNDDDRCYTVDNQLNLTGSVTSGFNSFVLLTIPLGGTASNYILGDGTNTGGGGSSTTSSSNTTSGGGSASGGGGGGTSSGGQGGGSGGGGGSGSGGPGGSGGSSGGSVTVNGSTSTASNTTSQSSSFSSNPTSSTTTPASTASSSPNTATSSSSTQSVTISGVSSSSGTLRLSTSAAASVEPRSAWLVATVLAILSFITHAV